MEPGATLYDALRRAEREQRPFFVYEYRPGTNLYRITQIPPEGGTYFRIDPNRTVTTIIDQPDPTCRGARSGNTGGGFDATMRSYSQFWCYQPGKIRRKH